MTCFVKEMGEVGVSSEGGGGVELEAVEGIEAEIAERKKDESGGSAAVLRWDRFLAKMAVRVLLVEADDSTRQVIDALLRKCGYKVTAVSDGLKAWELLKGKPHNVDLVLAEVDLPSISGYALLALIMEHEICKNIPVIMMSSRDSVSTVYGCMLRGAADFLVKPVRKNELMNLWQHVWRRQASSSGVRALDESVAQQKVEAMAENNAIFNGEGIEKGSDAQSSSTKPDMDTERENTESNQDLLQPNWDKSLPRIDQTSDEDPAQIKSCKQAIDLIGAFDNHLKCNYIDSSSNTSPNKVDSVAVLDLSLTRSYPRSLLNQFSDKQHRLNHSNGSAFAPYVNKGVQHRGLTLPIPVRTVRFEGLSDGYRPVISPTHSSGSGRLDSPLGVNPVHPFNLHAITSMQFTGMVEQNGDFAMTQTENNQSEPTDECGDLCSATNQSGNSSTRVPIVKFTAECWNEEVSLVQDGNSQRSSQREAALTKFRLKRKDRCYEKKVRYESRKKLAEQRPRVKGQFVRRQPSGPPPYDNKLITTANH